MAQIESDLGTGKIDFFPGRLDQTGGKRDGVAGRGNVTRLGSAPVSLAETGNSPEDADGAGSQPGLVARLLRRVGG